MSKASRVLAGFQWIFTIVNLPLLMFWCAILGKRATAPLPPSSMGFFVLFIATIYALVKAMTAEYDAPGYRRVMAILCLGHLAVLIYALTLLPLLPPLEAFTHIVEQGVNTWSLYWLAEGLMPLGHLIALIFGLVPLTLPLHPKVRSKL